MHIYRAVKKALKKVRSVTEERQKLEFFKQFIKEKLEKIREDIPARRYRLLLAVIDDCDDYNELREMAELDMQIDLFEYTKTEINPKVQQLNLDMDTIREAQSTYPVQEKPTDDTSPSDYTTEELIEDLDDPIIGAAMVAMLAARAASEPLEETYRDDMLNGSDDQPSLEDLETLEEEMGDFSGIGESLSVSDDEFDELGEDDLLSSSEEDDEDDTLDDSFGELDESDLFSGLSDGDVEKDKLNKAKADTADLIEDDDPFSDFDDTKKTVDKLFEDEEDEDDEGDSRAKETKGTESGPSDSSDDTSLTSLDDLDLDLDALGNDDDDEEEESEFVEDGDFEEAFGDMLNEMAAQNPLFEDTGDDDPVDLELQSLLGLDREGLVEDSSEDDDDSDGLDRLDKLLEDSFGDDDDEPDEPEEDLDAILASEFGDPDEDDEADELVAKQGDLEFDPADFGDFPDADDLFGGESSKNNQPLTEEEEADPFSSLGDDDDDFSGFDEQEDDEDDSSDPFSSLEDMDDEIVGADTPESSSEDLADDLFGGIEDDSDDFFSSQEEEVNKAPTQNSIKSQQKPAERKINAATIFDNGSKHGSETQKMFNTILKVGSLFGKAQSSIAKQAKRGVQSGARSLQQSGMFNLSSNS